MKKLDLFIQKHNETEKNRSSLSNLIKNIRLENELSIFIEEYMNFGSFKQKLYHYINDLGMEEIICPVCKDNKINWVEKDNSYRRVCSARCRGKLTNERNPNRKKIVHPVLTKKEEFVEYFKQNKIKLVESSLNKVYPDLVEKINHEVSIDVLFQEKVYLYLNNLNERPKCKHCDENEVEFTYFTKGYRDYCSVKCSSNSEEKKQSIISTCIEKYGVENIGECTRKKALATMFNKYGNHISKTKIFKDKFRKTSLERFGVEHPFMCPNVRRKRIDTHIERYGVENPLQSPDILNKTLQTRKENGHIYKWSEKELESIQLYRSAVTYYTKKTYEFYKHAINPDGLNRGIHTNHIDHIFPVIEGWKNDVDPKLISDYRNLRLIDSFDNLSKGDRTELSLEDFLNMVKD
jgi:hypothetical protein